MRSTPEQAQDVINFINRFSSSLNPYALYSTNCTTVCPDALKAIGILPRNYASITPFGLWSNLFSRFGKPAMQRYQTTNRYGEVFQSLRIDTPQGIDYGNSQFGINTFDFIMLMLQPQQEQVTSKICFADEDGKQVCP